MGMSRLVEALQPTLSTPADEVGPATILHAFHAFIESENARMAEAASLGIIAPEPDVDANVIMPNIFKLARTENVDPVAYFVSMAAILHGMAMNTLAFSAQCMMSRNPTQEQNAANMVLGYVNMANGNFEMFMQRITGTGERKPASNLLDATGQRLIQ